MTNFLFSHRRLAFFLFLSLIAMIWAAKPCDAVNNAQNTDRPPSQARTARVHGEKRRVNWISNFGQVTPMLSRGGQPDQEGFEALRKMGIDIVVDTRSNRSLQSSEAKQVNKLGMKYVPLSWHCPFPHDEVFAKFLKLMRDNPDKKVFVHCRLGDDRTGMMIAAYRMAEGWNADDAMLEMKAFGFTRAHHLICPRLASYERSFPKRLKNNPAFEGVRSLPPSTKAPSR
jgi:tyrosine-protein phosphatase SIW14